MKLFISILTLFFFVPAMAQEIFEIENPTVLLVSGSIQQADVLAAAVGDNVLVIQYEPESTNLNGLLYAIGKKLIGRKASSIGFAAHDYGEAKFYLTGEHTISLGSTLNNEEQQKFWKELGKFIIHDGRIDLFACNLAKADQGKMLVSSIAKCSERAVAASVDETGNPSNGGNWVLETSVINISDIYFDASKLGNYSSLLHSQRKKLIPSDPGSSDTFGGSVAIDGDFAIVGSHYDDVNVEGDGSAYIFFRNQGGENNWGQLKKLYDVNNTTDTHAWYGYTVAISGDYAVVGARQSDRWAANSGTAFVYHKNQGGFLNWGLAHELRSDDIGAWDFFGESVDISGTTVVIGAPWEDDADEGWGAAYIFEKDQGGTDNWGQVKKLVAPTRSSEAKFGTSVAHSGEWIIVGAPEENQSGNIWDAGSVYVFGKNYPSPNSWGMASKIVDPAMAEDDHFGESVDISSTGWAIVGAPRDNSNRGSAHLIGVHPTLGWEYRKNLGAPTYNSSYIGKSVSLKDDYAVVGGYGFHTGGRAFIFYRNQGATDNWGLYKTLTASDGVDGDQFGYGVAVSGTRAIVGANYDHAPEYRSGSAYLFEVGNTVSVAGATGGTTDKTGDNIVFDGDSISITASPSTGYGFVGWTGNASGSTNPLTIIDIYSDLAITPVFTRLTGTLNVNISAGTSGGSYTISGPSDFNSGTPLAGQTSNFSQVVPSGNYSVTFTEPASHNFSQIASSFTVNNYSATGALGGGATETITGSYAIKQYDVTVNSAANGSTNRDGTTSVDYGDSLSITAAPATNYFLSSWTGDASGSANPLNISNITSDYTITPVFTRFTGTLNVNLSDDGSGASYSISGPPAFNGGNPLTGQTGNYSQVIPTGDYTVTFSSHASHNFSMVASSFAITGYSAGGTLASNATETVTGTYAIKQYSVTVNPAELGTTDRDGTNTANYGSSLTITASPRYGVSFEGWSGDVTGSDNPLTISNITRDYSLTPVFENRKGSLRVFLNGTDDGRWRIAGKDNWLNSGEVFSDLHFGDITVECKPVPGFRKPRNTVATIRDEGIKQLALDYTIFTDAPIMHYFTATPDEVGSGGLVTLSWEAEGSQRVIITPDVGEINQDIGTAEVIVDKDTVFTLTAKNADRTSKASTSVKIINQLEIVSFSSNGGTLQPVYIGDEIVLSWFVRGADRALLTNKTTGVKLALQAQGSLTVALEETTVFQLLATGPKGETLSRTLRIKVNEEVAISSFVAKPASVYAGNQTTLIWKTRGADSVVISPQPGQVEAEGSSMVQPKSDTIYTLNAAGNGSQKTASANVVVSLNAPDLKLSLVGITSKGKEVVKPVSGQISTIIVEVENQGTETARNVVVSLEDVEGSSNNVVIKKLQPGKKVIVNLQWCAHAKGKHNLVISVDPLNEIGEINESNNLVRKTIRATEAIGVDLLADNLEAVLNEDGKTVTVTYTILNVGTTTSESFQYQLFLTKGAKQTINKALVLVADDYLDSLAPGESVAVTKVVELKKIPKRLYLQAKVDIHNAITEANEENNHIVTKVK